MLCQNYHVIFTTYKLKKGNTKDFLPIQLNLQLTMSYAFGVTFCSASVVQFCSVVGQLLHWAYELQYFPLPQVLEAVLKPQRLSAKCRIR